MHLASEKQFGVKSLAGVAVLAVALAALLWSPPASAVERWYSQGVYLPLQRTLTTTSNLTPFAWLDVLLVVLPLAWFAWMFRSIRRSGSRTRAIAGSMWRTAVLAAFLYLAFLFAWGLNYRRVPLEQKLPFDQQHVTAEAAREAALLSVRRLNALYDAAHRQDSPAPSNANVAFVQAFDRAMQLLGNSGTTVPARPKHTLLDLYFRPAAVAGMTDPFFLETLVESDLLPVEEPFVVAHEWTHLAGFADEGEANFGGWLTCTLAPPSAQYSGWLFLLGELAASVSRDARADVMARLDGGPRSDLRAIAARVARDVKPQISAAGWRVYDRYLKANRIEAGALSYGQVVRLVLGTPLGITGDRVASPAR